MWQSVICCLLAGLLMWIPRLVWRDECLDAARSRRAVLFRCRDAVSAGDQRRDGAVPLLAGTAGALVGGLQNIGSGVLASLSAMLPQTGQGSFGVIDDLNGIVDRAVLAAAGDADVASGAARLSARHHSIVISSMGERCCFIRSRITRICGAE